MTWILIYWITLSSHITTGHVEFNNEAACHAAFKEMGRVNTMTDLSGVCVPKG